MTKIQTDEEQLMRVFNRGFEELVIPALEDLENKMNVRFDRIERRLDDLALRVSDLEKKNKRLEPKVFPTS